MKARTETRKSPSGRSYILLIAEHEGVEMHADPHTRVIGWASDWADMHTFPLDRRYGGPGTYGHVDYVVPMPRDNFTTTVEGAAAYERMHGASA